MIQAMKFGIVKYFAAVCDHTGCPARGPAGKTADEARQKATKDLGWLVGRDDLIGGKELNLCPGHRRKA